MGVRVGGLEGLLFFALLCDVMLLVELNVLNGWDVVTFFFVFVDVMFS